MHHAVLSSLLGRKLASAGVMCGLSGGAILFVIYFIRANMPYASADYDYYLPDYSWHKSKMSLYISIKKLNNTKTESCEIATRTEVWSAIKVELYVKWSRISEMNFVTVNFITVGSEVIHVTQPRCMYGHTEIAICQIHDHIYQICKLINWWRKCVVGKTLLIQLEHTALLPCGAIDLI